VFCITIKDYEFHNIILLVQRKIHQQIMNFIKIFY